MPRFLPIVFTAAATAVALATVGYLIGFLADLALLPKTIDRPIGAPPATALPINLGLIALFGIQHSLMAREGVKARVRALVSERLERGVYLLATCATLILLYVFWQPIAGSVWRVESAAGALALWALFGFGWLLGGTCLLLMSVPELFGYRQALRGGRDADAPTRFRTPLYYQRIRHPLYLSFFFTFWAIPEMSYGHLLFAAAMSAYVLIAVRYEERDLVRRFGQTYRDYQARAGMLLPRLHSGRSKP